MSIEEDIEGMNKEQVAKYCNWCYRNTFQRCYSCPIYNARPTTLALDVADSAASPSESAGEIDQHPETDSA